MNDQLNNKSLIQCSNVNVYYADQQALFDINLDIRENEVTSLIGPSGCGKSTFLRCINRMNDVIDICKVEGSISIDNQNIYDPEVDVVELRSRIGMVFQKPNPFPKSVYDNVAYGPKLHGRILHQEDLDRKVEESLERAGLWAEVKDRLHEPGTSLSGGQQQRVAIARALANDPSIVWADEPTGNLDSTNAGEIMELLMNLNKEQGQTFVLVTHSDQVGGMADRIVRMSDGVIVDDGNGAITKNASVEEKG